MVDGKSKILEKVHEKACVSIKIVENSESISVYSYGEDLKLKISRISNSTIEVIKCIKVDPGTPPILSMDFLDGLFLLGH